jgi:hypothetical protein
MTCGLMPASIWRSAFGQDRAGLIGHKLDPDKLEKKVPQNMSGLDLHLSLLESLLAESRGKQPWILDTKQPSLADIAFYYQLDWGRNIAHGYGSQDLTGGELSEGGEEGADLVLNPERYPLIEAWYARFKQHISSLPSNEKRIGMGDEAGLNAIKDAVAQTQLEAEVPLLPTPASPLTELDERNGLKKGAQVSIAPDDTGMNDPSLGTLLAASPEEFVITPDPIDGRSVDLRLHFPRISFRCRPVGDSKL